MIKLLLLLLVMLVVVACVKRLNQGRQLLPSKAVNAVSYASVSVDEFQELVADEGMQLLDVRTPDEYDEGHIAGAVLVNVNDSDFVEQAASVLDKQRPVAVYCRSGRRSARAASLLTEQGYQVTNLAGGVMAWRDAGKTLIK